MSRKNFRHKSKHGDSVVAFMVTVGFLCCCFIIGLAAIAAKSNTEAEHEAAVTKAAQQQAEKIDAEIKADQEEKAIPIQSEDVIKAQAELEDLKTKFEEAKASYEAAIKSYEARTNALQKSHAAATSQDQVRYTYFVAYTWQRAGNESGDGFMLYKSQTALRSWDDLQKVCQKIKANNKGGPAYRSIIRSLQLLEEVEPMNFEGVDAEIGPTIETPVFDEF